MIYPEQEDASAAGNFLSRTAAEYDSYRLKMSLDRDSERGLHTILAIRQLKPDNLLADYRVDLAITGGEDSILPEKASVDDIIGCANYLVDHAMAGIREDRFLEEDSVDGIT